MSPKPEQAPKVTPPTAVERRAQRERERTPEQQQRYEEVTARAAAIQANGVPAPKGVSYGDGGKASKGRGR